MIKKRGQRVKGLFGEIGGKDTTGEPRHRWLFNIRLDRLGEGVYIVLVGKPEGKRPLGRPRRRWVNKIRLGLCGEGGV